MENVLYTSPLYTRGVRHARTMQSLLDILFHRRTKPRLVVACRFVFRHPVADSASFVTTESNALSHSVIVQKRCAASQPLDCLRAVRNVWHAHFYLYRAQGAVFSTNVTKGAPRENVSGKPKLRSNTMFSANERSHTVNTQKSS